MAENNNASRQEWEATNKAIVDLTSAMWDDFVDLRRPIHTRGNPPDQRQQQARGIADFGVLTEPATGAVYQRCGVEIPIRSYPPLARRSPEVGA